MKNPKYLYGIVLAASLLTGCNSMIVRADLGLSKPHTLNDAGWNGQTLGTARIRAEAGYFYADCWHHSRLDTGRDKGVSGCGAGITFQILP